MLAVADRSAEPHESASRVRRLTHHSTMREKVFEHLLLGQLGAELLARGIEYEVLRGESDKDGSDIILEAGNVTRHIQLKSSIIGGATAEVPINLRLAAKPSGCVIWLVYDPDARDFAEIRWFGSLPGQALPDPGDRVAKHSRANALGIKAERPMHRRLPSRRFERVEDIAELADRLFGMMPADPIAFLRSRLVTPYDSAEPEWLDRVRSGDFDAIPADIDWDHSAELAHLLDGYRLAAVAGLGEPDTFLQTQRARYTETGEWPGDAAALWATLFLEHRAARFAGALAETDTSRLDELCTRLRLVLTRS